MAFILLNVVRFWVGTCIGAGGQIAFGVEGKRVRGPGAGG